MQSAFVEDVLKAAFQVHAALAQKRFARLALDGTGGTMKSFAQWGAQSFLAAPGSIRVPDDRANVELLDLGDFLDGKVALSAVSERTMAEMLNETKRAARAIGVQLQLLGAGGPSDFDEVFSAMIREHADALLVFPSPMLYLEHRRIVNLAAKNRLPAVYPWRDGVDAGGLMAYGPNIPDLFRRAATYVDKILKGAKPGELPVEQPTKFELVINLKTAKALGLTIPTSLLQRADQVIE